MKQLIPFLLIGLLVSACSLDKTVNPPKDVLSQDKMVDVLYDLHLTDGLFTTRNFNRDKTMNAENGYSYVFKKHGITRQTFDKSMQFYTRHSFALENIYRQVEQKFEQEKEKMQKQSEQAEQQKSE